MTVDEEQGNKLLTESYPRIMQLINSPDTDDIERVYAKFVTGAYYYFGLGKIEKDYNKAFEIIKECTDKGHIAAIYDLGANFYYNGNGTEKNYRLSEHYLNIAKQAGLKRAIDKYEEYEYGDVYANKMQVVYDILVKYEGEEYYHVVSILDEFLIPVEYEYETTE